MSMITVEGEGHSISGCNFTVQHPQIDKYNIFVVLYASNQLTLCQAMNALQNAILRETGGSQVIRIKDLFEIFGHRLCEEDQIQVEHGYDGNVQAWFDSGHKPVGWYQLFKDNYEQYKEKTCTQQTTDRETMKTLADVPLENLVATTLNEKAHTT